jgi:hypothetical protein
MGRTVDRKRHQVLSSLEPHARVAHCEHSRHPALGHRQRDSARPHRISFVPPVELVLGQPRAPDVVHQREEARPQLRPVRDDLQVGHFDDVPSAALNSRRACVPATVSFTAIRSHAPERTSSNVLGGYGSAL